VRVRVCVCVCVCVGPYYVREHAYRAKFTFEMCGGVGGDCTRCVLFLAQRVGLKDISAFVTGSLYVSCILFLALIFILKPTRRARSRN
jgi:hypothetical protein